MAEFGQADPDVRALVERSQRLTDAIFGATLERARQAGEVAPGIDPAAAAHFIHTAIRGMRISAKAGASTAQLGKTVDFTLASLRARGASVAEV